MNKIKSVKKPWGKELWFACTKNYAGKILCVNKGHRLSLQYHKVKEETLLLDKGILILQTGTSLKNLKTRKIKAGTMFHLPPKTIHRMQAINNCRLIEVSTPQLSDVVRLDDDYNRLKRHK